MTQVQNSSKSPFIGEQQTWPVKLFRLTERSRWQVQTGGHGTAGTILTASPRRDWYVTQKLNSCFCRVDILNPCSFCDNKRRNSCVAPEVQPQTRRRQQQRKHHTTRKMHSPPLSHSHSYQGNGNPVQISKRLPCFCRSICCIEHGQTHLQHICESYQSRQQGIHYHPPGPT